MKYLLTVIFDSSAFFALFGYWYGQVGVSAHANKTREVIIYLILAIACLLVGHWRRWIEDRER